MRILLLAILSHLAVCGIGSAQSPATKTPAKPDADAKDPKETTEAKSLSSAKDLIAAVPRETLAHLRPGPRMEEALSQANSAMMTRIYSARSGTLASSPISCSTARAYPKLFPMLVR